MRLKEYGFLHAEAVETVYADCGWLRTEDGARLENLPQFCRVLLRKRPGAGSLIHTEVWLPEKWNGIFLGLGNGGMGGCMDYDALARHIRLGYAAANTDLGTSRGRNSGIGNPDVWKDFGWRATHEMTAAGKELVRAYYGRPADYAYFLGGSTGGQQGLMEAQRFPADYDGILAGMPANNRTHLHTYFLWNHIQLRTESGRPRFSQEEIQEISRCAVRYYQGRGDGCPGDPFITFPRPEAREVSDFIRFLGSALSWLSAEQTAALRRVYAGPVNPVTGRRIYNGMPIGAECYGCGIADCQAEESPHFYPFIWVFGADYDGRRFDFNEDLKALNLRLAPELNANRAELTAFHRHGGKLILYSGSADPCVPFPDALNYYLRAAAQAGGAEVLREYCRYFLFPGMEHGSRGMGTNAVWENESGGDALTALRRWRETGTAPDMLTAVGYRGGDPENGIAFKRPVPCWGLGPAEMETARSARMVCEAAYLLE